MLLYQESLAVFFLTPLYLRIVSENFITMLLLLLKVIKEGE